MLDLDYTPNNISQATFQARPFSFLTNLKTPIVSGPAAQTLE